MKRLLHLALLSSLSLAALGQIDLTGYRRFPSLRSISGLPGGGFGVNFDGRISFDGAMAISTPIGMTLRGHEYAFSGSVTSKDGAPRFYNMGSENNSRGIIQAMSGFTLPFGFVSGTFEVISGHRNNVTNWQFSPNLKQQNLGVSVGVQNISNHMAASGTGTVGDDTKSRSIYAAATYAFRPGYYGTLGVGDNNRFRGVFGSFNVPLGSNYKLVTEYDTFNFNSSIAIKGPVLKRFLGSRDVQSTIFLGYIREKYLNYMITFAL